MYPKESRECVASRWIHSRLSKLLCIITTTYAVEFGTETRSISLNVGCHEGVQYSEWFTGSSQREQTESWRMGHVHPPANSREANRRKTIDLRP
jgi:hypothetical protein